jgi:long-subunit fatty acid transport protein
VIKGTWWTGEGDVYQPDKRVVIKAGGFVFIRPVKTVQTEVDEKGQPVGRRGAGNQ